MKRAIIIGASSGIGREVSLKLLKKGWHIGIAARRMDRLEEIKSLSPDAVEVMQIDVTGEEAAGKLLTLVNEVGGVNLFFLASGTGKQNPQLDCKTEDATVDVNVKGFTRMIDAMFNYMAEHGGGDIAAITSVAGTKGIGIAPSYSASKAYQSHYIQALEQLSNMRHLHIRFTDIRPGFVDTELLGDKNFPMLMDKAIVADKIIYAVMSHKHVSVIDWRYKIVVFLWKLIPRWGWRKLNIEMR